jgi:hypothetical protein
MSLYIHVDNLIFNLKFKLVMSCQLIALVILDNHQSHFRQVFSIMLIIFFSHICVKNDWFVLIACNFFDCLMWVKIYPTQSERPT